jgi:hypothetical protein
LRRGGRGRGGAGRYGAGAAAPGAAAAGAAALLVSRDADTYKYALAVVLRGFVVRGRARYFDGSGG